MTIIAILYIGVVWLLFFRFKLLPWNMTDEELTISRSTPSAQFGV
jgi:hypothetical protein